MNERIDKLFGQALDQAVPETWTMLTPAQLSKLKDKFAELIVRECYEHCKGQMLDKEVADTNELTYNDAVMDCSNGLLQHFGVEL